MVIVLSYIIAVILTVLIAILLYPISGLLFVIGKIGEFIGFLSSFTFSHTNRIIKKMWSDIKHTKVVRDPKPSEDKPVSDAEYIPSEDELSDSDIDTSELPGLDSEEIIEEYESLSASDSELI